MTMLQTVTFSAELFVIINNEIVLCGNLNAILFFFFFWYILASTSKAVFLLCLMVFLAELRQHETDFVLQGLVAVFIPTGVHFDSFELVF